MVAFRCSIHERLRQRDEKFDFGDVMTMTMMMATVVAVLWASRSTLHRLFRKSCVNVCALARFQSFAAESQRLVRCVGKDGGVSCSVSSWRSSCDAANRELWTHANGTLDLFLSLFFAARLLIYRDA